MKKIWVAVIVIFIVAAIALFAYKPNDTTVNDLNSQANSVSGEQAQTGAIATTTNTSSTSNTSSSTAAPAQTTPSNTPSGITSTELSSHSTKNDCWIAYGGKVYDVTSYLPVHPGSSGAISPYCGTSSDFESAFKGKHGTSKVTTLQKRGVLKGNLI